MLKSTYLWHHNIPNIMRKFSLAVDGEAGLLALGCFQLTPCVLLSCSPPLVEAWFHLARSLPCHISVHWFTLPCIAQTNHCLPVLSGCSFSFIGWTLSGSFYIPRFSALIFFFLKKRCSLFCLYTDNLLNKIISLDSDSICWLLSVFYFFLI